MEGKKCSISSGRIKAGRGWSEARKSVRTGAVGRRRGQASEGKMLASGKLARVEASLNVDAPRHAARMSVESEREEGVD